MKCAREKQEKFSNSMRILEQGFYLLVELVKKAISLIIKVFVLFSLFYFVCF